MTIPPAARWRRPLVAAATAAVLLLGACATPSGSAGKAAADPENKPLVIVLNAALASIDPVKANSQRTEGNVLTSVYSTLTRVNPDGTLVGDLATSWKQTDPNTWDFTIRTGATFTNGDPLGAEQVAAGIARYFDKTLGAKGTSSIPTFKDVKAVGQDHVVITTKSPNFEVPWHLEQFYLVDPVFAADHDLSSQAVGSGPYKLASYDPQGTIKLERNDAYYGDKPAFRQVSFRVIPEEASRIAAIKAGEVDIAATLDPQSLSQLRSDAWEVGSIPGLRTHFGLFDARSAPFNDQRVRQAVNYAIDRSAITQSIFGGLVQPGVFINEGTPGHDPGLAPYPYNPEKAKALLAEAGYANGLTIEFLNAPGSYAGDDLTVQAIAEQLSRVGITVTIKNLPYTTYLEHVLQQNGQQPSALNFRSYGGSSAATLASSRFRLYETGAPGGTFSDPVYDALLTKARSAQTPDEQNALYQQANRRLYDQAAVLYLFNEPQTYAYKKSLDWVPRAEQWLRPYDVKPAT